MRTLEEIDADIKRVGDIYDAKFCDTANSSRSWEEFCKWAEPEIQSLTELSRERRMLMPYEFHKIPDYADVMLLKDFIECCNLGDFIDYDGDGYYVMDGQETDILIKPSDVKHGAIRWEFDSVAWYNK